MEGTEYRTKEEVLKRAQEARGIPLKDIDKTGSGRGDIVRREYDKLVLTAFIRGDRHISRVQLGIFIDKPGRFHEFLRQFYKASSDRRCEFAVRKKLTANRVFDFCHASITCLCTI